MKVKVVRGTTSRQVRRYMEGNKRASRSRYVQSRTTPSRSTGSGLKNSLESKNTEQMVHSTKTKLETKKILDIGKYRLRARAGRYSVLIGESNVAIDPAIGGYGVADIYLGEFSPHSPLPGTQAGSSANLPLKSSSPRTSIHQ